MAQTINSGLVQSSLIVGAQLTTQPIEPTTVKYRNATGSAQDLTLTVPANKKWIVISINLYSVDTGTTYVGINGNVSSGIIMAQIKLAAETFTSNNVFVLTAAETIDISLRANDSYIISYYEIDA